MENYDNYIEKLCSEIKKFERNLDGTHRVFVSLNHSTEFWLTHVWHSDGVVCFRGLDKSGNQLEVILPYSHFEIVLSARPKSTAGFALE